ncbi:hypothetical protein ADU80_05010 [Clostridium botulinum]|uniref:helix-turn-helix domain-containing protein n=2 Tax=Clostridium botulinum TaxID=1491 RepID=UPI00031E1148|nr:helix-turn-helix domain-containing protein [Clostridium botulinum]KLU74186.1 hypothetical protein CBC3_p0326 [Clostridium botulinum V891]KOA76622.1 hypothetical protein ADU78_05955 [Clostridium botulinum]KOA86420.1 hypothetical protein ADU80_05010 [Clostridium botulinum]KOC34079.1 hypothetical protein ADU82_10890 [Clostridium botulinum]KOC42104.1 hypothetical protein ADU84_06930 [Clostridium botulinum]
MDKKFNIKNIMDLKEASIEYNLNMSTLKSICQKGWHGLIEGEDYRKAGRVWLITREAIEKIIKNTNK